jgi:hypothetical protein
VPANQKRPGLAYTLLWLLVGLLPLLIVLINESPQAVLIGWICWFATGAVPSALVAFINARQFVYVRKRGELTATPPWVRGFLWASTMAGLYLLYNLCVGIVWIIGLVCYEDYQRGRLQLAGVVVGAVAALLTLAGLVEGAWTVRHRGSPPPAWQLFLGLRALLGILVWLAAAFLTVVCLDLYIQRSVRGAPWWEVALVVLGVLTLLAMLVPFVVPSLWRGRKPWLLCVILCFVVFVMLQALPNQWWRRFPGPNLP